MIAALLFTFAAAFAGTPQAPAVKSRPPAATPRTFEQISKAALAAREAGRLDEATSLFRRGLTIRADWDEGRWYLGSILYERERYTQARDTFAALVARQPTHAGAVGMQGLCEFALGKHDLALRTLLQARELGIARTPELGRVVGYHTGILLTRFGEFEAGYGVLSELARDDAESPRVVEAIGVNVLRMPILPAALPADQKPLVTLAGRAALAMAGRRLADATTLFDELVATYPKEPNVHYARGVLRTTEAPDKAIEDFAAELTISPAHIPARLQLVSELLKKGEIARARTYAAEAVRLAPDQFAVHLSMGQVWFESGDLTKAIASFEHGVALAPESAQAHFLLARAYGRAGRTADAERERLEFTRLQNLKAGAPGKPDK